MASSYVPLRLQSNYSLLSGASPIRELMDRAAELRLDTVALADLNNLYATVLFQREARSRGLKPVLGVTLEHDSGSGVLLARNLEGYRNLCRVISRRQLDPSFDFALCLSRFHENLHILVEDPDLAAAVAARTDTGRVWLALEEPAAYRGAREALRGTGVRPVAASPVLFARPSGHGRHKVLRAIRLRTNLSRLRSRDVSGPKAFLQDPNSMAARWRDLPEALRNTRAIASDCELEIPGGRWVFPRSKDGEGESLATLRNLCREGILRRSMNPDGRTTERMERELGVIETLGFTGYFLIVGEIVRFARSRGIPTVGRGSGAGSLVAYLLGITNVDPMALGLCFERFLHDKREDCPDLDIDLCWRGRDEVIDHVYRVYGNDRVAMLSTHNRFHSRSAFREVAKVFGLSPEEVTRLGKWLRRRGGLAEAAARGPGMAASGEECLPTILRVAREIDGFPRHLGIHSGGVVIADTRLDDYLALERTAKGRVVTQPDMRGVEALGLVKMDLLGNRALSTVRDAVDLVHARGDGRIEMGRLRDHDESAGDLLSRGETLGCFQIESPGMRSLLAKLRVRSLGETIAALSLIRPGPAGSGMKNAYVRRAAGLEPIPGGDPRIAPVLADTYGVMLYQEDVMRVASRVTGVSLAEADLLRRAIGGASSPGATEALGEGFVRSAVANGFEKDTAHEIWTRLSQFSAYSFCKAHASGYGALAYDSAYLKAHYPVEFTVALMNNHQGMYPRWVHLEEARRRGVTIRGPCVNVSCNEFTAEDGCLRVGLSQVRNLNKDVREGILASRRRDGPFVDLADFQSRTDMSLPEAEALVLAGALDFTGQRRPELLWELHTSHRVRQRTREIPVRGELLVEGPPPLGLREFPPGRRARYEFEVLGISLAEHPLRWICRNLGREGLVLPGRPAMAAGRRVRAVGLLSTMRSVETRGGARMAFVTLDDETGPFECVLFPNVYRRERVHLEGWGPYEVQGVVEEEFGVPALTVERLQRIEQHSARIVL